MRVLCFGGRTYNDRQSVYDTMNEFHGKTPITLVIHGACRNKIDMGTGYIIWSADMLAQEWANDHYIPYLGVPAVWYVNRKLDRSAGPKRNALMITKGKPQAGIGFPGGKGTADMAEKLIAAGVNPHIVVAI